MTYCNTGAGLLQAPEQPEYDLINERLFGGKCPAEVWRHRTNETGNEEHIDTGKEIPHVNLPSILINKPELRPLHFVHKILDRINPPYKRAKRKGGDGKHTHNREWYCEALRIGFRERQGLEFPATEPQHFEPIPGSLLDELIESAEFKKAQQTGRKFVPNHRTEPTFKPKRIDCDVCGGRTDWIKGAAAWEALHIGDMQLCYVCLANVKDLCLPALKEAISQLREIMRQPLPEFSDDGVRVEL